MKKTILYQLIILGLLLLSIRINAQENTIILSQIETESRVVEATNSVILLPGFSTSPNHSFTAKILTENQYMTVQGYPYYSNENLNWIASSSYNFSGKLTSSNVSYFNTLGKATQSHSLDIKTGKIWVNEVRYDEFGRPIFNTLSAPIGTSYGYKSDFIMKIDGNAITDVDIQNIKDNSAIGIIGKQNNSLGWYYSENNDSEKYQDVTDFPFSKVIYSTLNPGVVLKTLGGNKIQKDNENSKEWLQSYSFTMPMAQELFYAFGTNYFPSRELVVEEAVIQSPTTADNEGYYVYKLQLNCEGFIYENVRLTGNETLSVGSVYKIFYNNVEGYYKIVDSFFKLNNHGGGGGEETPSASNSNPVEESPSGNATLMGNTAYNCPSGRPYYIQGNKTIVRDVNGVESVIFKDGEGKVLASARSGNEDMVNRPKYKVISPIGSQGYVDIHIPVGCDGNITFKGAPAADFTIYNLITEEIVNQGGVITDSQYYLPAGMYRIEEDNTFGKNKNPFVTIDGNGTINLLSDTKNIGVEYEVNYYDFSLNYYDKAGRLTKSIQPLGFEESALGSLSPAKNHLLASTFTYNSLGQLQSTTNPDEGTANFKYRKDGQIRFSQNSKQLDPNQDGNTSDQEFSYTNYDDYGRPIESGVISGVTFDQNLDPNADLPVGTKKEQHFTLYDEIDTSLFNVLTTAQIPTESYKQTFTSGSVSKTYTLNPSTTTTWYGYDIYGRVKWMVQKIDGLGVKTIDYEYDFATGLVTKVIYQKHQQSDLFAHKYTYNVAGELYKVETSTDNKIFTEQAKYKYYETGALKRVEIAENVQGIDYIYNLAGQLKAINHPSRESGLDPGHDGLNNFAKDLFGFAIDYYNGDYARTNTTTPVSSSITGVNQYNGNIKATRWSTDGLSGGGQNGQIYTYNKNNWLKSASFGTALNNGQINISNDYKVSNITYDINGNIQSLNRTKDTYNGSNTMDELSYVYQSNKSNKLKKVNDAIITNTNANDIKNQLMDENYKYNAIGQLIEDWENVTQAEKDNYTTNGVMPPSVIKYIYNASGLVTEIVQNNLPKVKFFYNDRGHRVKKESYIDARLSKETYYVLDASGSAMSIQERNWNLIAVTPGASLENTPTPFNISKPIYGASRIGIHYGLGASYQLTDHLGNVRAVVTKNEFSNIIHTDFNNGNVAPWVKSTNTTSMNVENGRLKIVTKEHLNGANGYYDLTANKTYKIFVEVDKTSFNAPLEFSIWKGNSKKSSTFITENGILSTSFTPTQTGSYRLNFRLRQSGYSGTDQTLYIDNVYLKEVQEINNMFALKSATNYYPFGMPMPNQQIINGEPYRYAYQGQEKDSETNKEAFQLRLWDARIGRWLTTDPMSVHHSPYQGMANNPIIIIDPNGGYPTPFEAALMAAFIYGNTNISLIGGWELSRQIRFNVDDKQSGLKAALFERIKDNGEIEYAYVFEGTTNWDWDNDGGNNIRQALGNSEQYAKALSIVTDLSIYYQQNELTFVGHSLGGGLANYSSLATGRSSITFDPAWLSESSIRKIKTTIPLAFRPDIQQINYVPKGASLHMVQNSTGASIFVKPVGENIFIGDFSDNFRLNIIEVHDIDNITQRIFDSFRNSYKPIGERKRLWDK